LNEAKADGAIPDRSCHAFRLQASCQTGELARPSRS
jgi:hypothetical protein